MHQITGNLGSTTTGGKETQATHTTSKQNKQQKTWQSPKKKKVGRVRNRRWNIYRPLKLSCDLLPDIARNHPCNRLIVKLPGTPLWHFWHPEETSSCRCRVRYAGQHLLFVLSFVCFSMLPCLVSKSIITVQGQCVEETENPEIYNYTKLAWPGAHSAPPYCVLRASQKHTHRSLSVASWLAEVRFFCAIADQALGIVGHFNS